MDPDVLRATRDLIVSMVDWSEIDLIVRVEAMGLPLLPRLARHLESLLLLLESDLMEWRGKWKLTFPQDIQNLQHISTISNPERGYLLWMM